MRGGPKPHARYYFYAGSVLLFISRVISSSLHLAPEVLIEAISPSGYFQRDKSYAYRLKETPLEAAQRNPLVSVCHSPVWSRNRDPPAIGPLLVAV